jgi:hypothetical protein
MKPPKSSNTPSTLEEQVFTPSEPTNAMTFSFNSPNLSAVLPSPSSQHPTATVPSRVAVSDEMLTKRELAARLKKTPRCIEQWMGKRYLPYIKIGHTVLFRWKNVVEALERMTIR